MEKRRFYNSGRSMEYEFELIEKEKDDIEGILYYLSKMT